MKKSKNITQLLLIMFLHSVFCCQTSPEESERLIIAAAANMQFAVSALCESFEEKTGIGSELIISSSGKLTAQIKEGAPYHLFISADMQYPEELFRSGLAEKPPRVYAYGKLVLWSMVEGIQPSLKTLSSKRITHIALANPKTAPYGKAAQEFLKHYQLLDPLQAKLVFGESIAQTNQFITTQVADLGFTAKSVVVSPKMRGKGNWIDLDPGTYTPIQQGVLILKASSQQQQQAQKFYEFLFSAEAKRILEAYGYLVKVPPQGDD